MRENEAGDNFTEVDALGVGERFGEMRFELE
jgi:hypothetical protein